MRAAKKRPSLGGKARLFWFLAKTNRRKSIDVGAGMAGFGGRFGGGGRNIWVGTAEQAGLEGPGGDFGSRGGRNGCFGGSGA